MTQDAIDRLCERIRAMRRRGDAPWASVERDVRAALEGERDRVEKLRTALRVYALYRVALTMNDWKCGICGREWLGNEPEQHKPGCLAAPETP